MKEPWWSRELVHRILLALVATLAIAISVAVLATEWLGLSHALREYVPAGTLILLATFVLFFLVGYERRMEKVARMAEDSHQMVQRGLAGMVEHARKLQDRGLRELYLRREDPGQWDGYLWLLRGARRDLFIVGITLKDMTKSQHPLFMEKAEAGCSIRLLMLTPARWKNSEPVLDPIEMGTLKEHFATAVRNIRVLATDVAAAARCRSGGARSGVARAQHCALEVRFYDQAPTLSLTVADGESETGQMRVEFTPHNESNLRSYFRPMLDVGPAGSELFKAFRAHYEGLWKRSEYYVRVKGDRIESNPASEEVIRRELGLDSAWAPPARTP